MTKKIISFIIYSFLFIKLLYLKNRIYNSFITIYAKSDAKERFISLGKTFQVQQRLFERGDNITFEQLLKPLKINQRSLNSLKFKSIK